MNVLAAIAIAACAAAASPATAAQPSANGLPVGARYDPDPDPARRRTDLENMRRLRFTVVALGTFGGGDTRDVVPIDRLLAGDTKAAFTMRAAELGVVPVGPRTAPEGVRESAWTLIASGARGVLFDDWKGLQQNERALAEAGAFAEGLTRNSALYEPLRKVPAAGDRAFTIDRAQGSIEAHWLESDDALVLIAVNHAAQAQEVTIMFAPAIPEAIWQNMLSGSAVNFVAGPSGPFYQRRFAPHEVVVLMIRKRLK